MSETGQRIKELRKKMDISADVLADKLGVSRSTIFRYEKGDIEKVPAKLLESIANALHTTPAYLMGWEENDSNTADLIARFPNLHPVEKRKFPMLGSVACGKPIMANKEFETYVMADIHINADFCLTAVGDSMIGASIHDGDIVFIKEQNSVDNGEIAAVCIDEEVTLKRVYFNRAAQSLYLQAENPAYDPLVYQGEDLDHVHIVGKAVYCMTVVR